jgi:eukaryotic-like serine/threonine-protein kinase
VQAVSFGKYQLQERLGEGGMAVVWRAKLFGPGGFEKTLVVKQIRDELAKRHEFIDLFVAEAKLTVSLTHANIVPVYELGMVEGTYFLALELVDGPPLTTIIDDGPVPPPLASYVVEQVLRGLDYAHRRGVVHRDLSSANVLVSRDGEVKIVDFGIAAPVDARGPAGGSRGYMAPEQEAGGNADARSDLYAAGVLLWELVRGRRWDGSALGAPHALHEIVAKATARDPEARFADAAAMLAAVSRFLRSATGAMTQAELGNLVRQRCPDLPAPRDGEDDGEDEGDEPAGPRTLNVRADKNVQTHNKNVRSHHEKQVTFATRIAPPPRPPLGWKRIVGYGAGGLALLGLAALGGARLRDGASTSPLPSLPKTARLVVRVLPPEATLTVDGKPAAPGALELPAGRHVVTATARDLQPATREVTLTAGGASDVTLALEAARVALSVKSDPPGAEVLLGDRALGTTPLSLTLPIALPARVKLRKHDFAVAERAVEPHDGAFAVDVKLAPLPRGELTLGALPWAHVTVDGEKRADTPLAKLSLAAGAHLVKLSCPPTGKELKFSVTIEPGKELRKVADLRAEPHLVE